MSKEEFEEKYAKASGVTVDFLRKNHLEGVTCDCEESGCDGWKMDKVLISQQT